MIDKILQFFALLWVICEVCGGDEIGHSQDVLLIVFGCFDERVLGICLVLSEVGLAKFFIQLLGAVSTFFFGGSL
jgi:hypothetical protein